MLILLVAAILVFLVVAAVFRELAGPVLILCVIGWVAMHFQHHDGAAAHSAAMSDASR